MFGKQKEGSKDLPVAVSYSKQENVTIDGVGNIESKV